MNLASDLPRTIFSQVFVAIYCMNGLVNVQLGILLRSIEGQTANILNFAKGTLLLNSERSLKNLLAETKRRVRLATIVFFTSICHIYCVLPVQSKQVIPTDTKTQRSS